MSTDPIVSTSGLAKHFGDVRAVDGIDLSVRRGEIYGFLGRNGAGKTTTIRMLLGLIRPTSGDVRIFGTRLKPGEQDVLRRVGCLVETATSYPNLTARENLDIHRRLTGAPPKAVGETIALMGLEQYSDRRAGHLSLGNKQRLALARALLNRPELLVLDEPANGLDPAGIVEVRGLLRQLARERGVAIFMSSHILAEVAHLADRIGIVHAGRLVEELSFDELRAKAHSYLEVAVSDPAKAASLLTAQLAISRIERAGEHELRVFVGPDRAAEIASVLVTAGLELTRLSSEEEDLEAYFMRMTGGTA